MVEEALLENSEITNDTVPAAPAEPVEKVGEPKAEKPLSLREELSKASKESKERVRDETGKFAKEQKKPESSIVEQKATENTKADDKRQSFAKTPSANLDVAPRAYKNIVKEKWGQIPEEIRADILRREEAVELGFTKVDEERHLGRQMKDVIMPYIPMIQAEGSNPVQTVKSLLNTAYMLRDAGTTSRQKGELLRQVAAQFGADLTTQSSPGSPANPELEALRKEVAELKQGRNQDLTARQQQEDQSIQSLINAFAADPKNVHFEAVKPKMGALMANGQAKDLQEAYDMAVWADPTTRSTLIEQRQAEGEAKRLADIKQKAEAAKKAGASINGGGPGAAIPNAAPTNRSLRDELKANFGSHRIN